MGEVADLFASLGVKIDGSSWAKANEAMAKAKSALDGLDRAADKLATSTRAAKASERAAAAKEREAARAMRAVRSLEREEERAEAARVRTQQRAIAVKERTAASAAAKTKRAAEKEAHEAEARRDRLVSRVESGGAFLGATLGGLAFYMGEKVVRSGIEFNATMEDSKNEVAGMLALVNKSHLADELKNADMLVDNLRERAAKLPGTTQEYIQMLSMITQPIMDAKLGLKDLEDLTVNSVVAAKGLHVPWEVAARDIDQAIRGQFHSIDPFSGKVLGTLGYKGEEGRSRYNALSQEKRASEFKRALLQPQFNELGEAAGNSFHGTLSTLQDSWEYFTGTIGKGLFDEIGKAIKQVNEWLDENKVAVAEVASQIGGVLVGAFHVLSAVIGWLIEHGDLVLSVLGGIAITLTGLAIAWLAGFWPIFAIIAAVSALIYGIQYLIRHGDKIKAAFAAAWDAIKRGAIAVADAIKDAFDALLTASGIGLLIDAYNFFAGKGGKGSLSTKHEEMVRDSTEMSPDEFRKKYPQSESWEPPTFVPQTKYNEDTGPAIRREPTVSAGSGAYAMNIDVGGINVTSNASDPVVVAQEVARVFDERLTYHVRRTMDEVA